MSTEKTQSQTTIEPVQGQSEGAPKQSFVRRVVVQPEFITVILLILAFIVGSIISPYFLDLDFLLNYTSLFIEVGIMALGMTFIIISANIDLSVASTLALVGAVAGVLFFDLSIPMGLTIALALLLSVGLGALNGLLVTRMRLPALAVTLATLALYRGAAQVLVGDDSRPKLAWSRDIVFPEWFVGVHRVYIPGTSIPLPLVLFIVLAILLGIILHKTNFGRWVYAVGTNEEAARYAGVPTQRVKLAIFAMMGLLSGIAGLIMVSRLSVARYDHARGWELDVITAVVLGGTDIYGGRGTIFGTVAAFLLIIFLRTGMGVANVKAESQLAVIGTLLIVAILVSNLTKRIRN
ncbi:MAG: ABC transporter permease [Chloroflexota bacterium]|nr:MAG: ABC transporter permease [Chloroflexota bacterium]